MDFHQLEYILMIAQENNITRAAEKLYISQSALNQQLLKLEKELGCQLFHRSRTDWHPTEAGEIYLDGARKAMMLRKETYQKINDLIHSQKSTLTIGLTPGRGFRMFMGIYAKLHERYENLNVTPIEMTVRAQQEAITKGDIDIGFVTLSDDEKSSDSYVEIGREEMMVVIPKFHPLAKSAAPAGEEFATIDISSLQYEPFAMMYKTSTNRAICDKICKRAGFVPNILFETSSTASILYMVQLGLCCAILPRYYLSTADMDKIAAFTLPDHPCWELCITYRKGSYLSDGAHTFIHLAAEYWTEHLIPPQTN